ncbi:MAG: hypothetical protein N3B21_15395 [Clostridia bacterium]|nr:hypothetical protein [Clostridia bacterium]
MGRFEKIVSIMLVPVDLGVVLKVQADNWNKSSAEQKWILSHYILPLMFLLGIGYLLYYKLRIIYYTRKNKK